MRIKDLILLSLAIVNAVFASVSAKLMGDFGYSVLIWFPIVGVCVSGVLFIYSISGQHGFIWQNLAVLFTLAATVLMGVIIFSDGTVATYEVYCKACYGLGALTGLNSLRWKI